MKIPTLLLALLLALPSLAQFSANPAQNLAVRDQPGVSEVTPLTAPGPNGGTWVSWFEPVPTTNYQLRMQLLDRGGFPLLGPGGVVVNNQAQGSALFRYDLTSDAAGNAIVGLQDMRSGSSQIVVHKISTAGLSLWGPAGAGIVLPGPAGTTGIGPTLAVLASDNVVVTWGASASTTTTVAMQKLSPTGTLLWPAPVSIVLAGARTERPAPLAVGADEFVLCYVRRSGNGLGVSSVLAQRFNANGDPMWGTPVAVSSNNVGFVFFPEPVADGSGGFFVALNSGNPASASLGDVWVQHVGSTGSLWSATGTEALTGTATARFDGRLQYVAARNELWAAITVTNTGQSQSGIALQRFDSATGTAQLGAAGAAVQPISSALAATWFLRDTGTGLLVVYTEATSALNNVIKVVKHDYLGAAVWPAPLPLASAASGKLHYDAPPFANGQLVLAWEDTRQDAGIYAQNISDNGTLGPLATAGPHPVQHLEMWPNPGITPKVQLPASARPVAVQVRDLMGRLVLETTASGILSLDGAVLPSGLYLVEASVEGRPIGRSRWLRP